MGNVSLEGIMRDRFNEIETNFRIASVKFNLKFDCDMFIETYLMCCESLKEKDLDETSILKYFWVSFLNNSKKIHKKTKYTPNMIEVDCNICDDSYIEYDESTLTLCDIINEKIEEKFGISSRTVWELHFIENKTYDELSELGYIGINFHNLFRKIIRYVKITLPKENVQFKILLKDVYQLKK